MHDSSRFYTSSIRNDYCEITDLHIRRRTVHCRYNLQDSDIQSATCCFLQADPWGGHAHLRIRDRDPLKLFNRSALFEIMDGSGRAWNDVVDIKKKKKKRKYLYDCFSTNRFFILTRRRRQNIKKNISQHRYLVIMTT